MKKINVDEFINSSITAIKEVYKLSKSLDNNLKNSFEVGFGGDVSIGMDLEAERIYFKYLKKFGSLVSEESGKVGDDDIKIILDPLDGSDNFKSNFPYFGSSIALKYKYKILCGIIVNLANGDIFIKKEGFFKRKKIFEDSFFDIKTNPASSIGIFEKGYKDTKLVDNLKKMGIKYRIPGALAISLAYARWVDFVLFEGMVREFDVAAGRYMCEDLFLYEKKDLFLVSKDEKIFKKIRDLL